MRSRPIAVGQHIEMKGRRPAPAQRKFRREAVDATIAEVKRAIGDPDLALLFENCFPNTLDTTVSHQEVDGKPDTFVITGDIPAMWLRDSSAHVWPYLPLVRQEAKLKSLLAGVLNRQARCLLIDPYANAFNFSATGSEWAKDLTAMKPELHEMSTIMRAMTSADPAETQQCLKTLKTTHAHMFFMHESFNQDDPTRFTRSWFAWANTLFGELILKIYAERRELLKS